MQKRIYQMAITIFSLAIMVSYLVFLAADFNFDYVFTKQLIFRPQALSDQSLTNWLWFSLINCLLLGLTLIGHDLISSSKNSNP